MHEPKCLRCKHQRITDQHGRYMKRNKFVRGLCATCYPIASASGTLDEIALPAKSRYAGFRPMWGTVMTLDGYLTLKTPAGVMLEHRYVMEQFLGRILVGGENVHHINGVRDDNRIENLELWYSAQPYGQRVEQLIEYMAEFHAERMKLAIIEREQAEDL